MTSRWFIIHCQHWCWQLSGIFWLFLLQLILHDSSSSWGVGVILSLRYPMQCNYLRMAWHRIYHRKRVYLYWTVCNGAWWQHLLWRMGPQESIGSSQNANAVSLRFSATMLRMRNGLELLNLTRNETSFPSKKSRRIQNQTTALRGCIFTRQECLKWWKMLNHPHVENLR